MQSGAGSIDADVVSRNQMEPIFAVDSERSIAFANQRFYTVYGLSPDETIGADLVAIRQVVDSGFDALEGATQAVADGESAEERVEITTVHPEDLPIPRRLPVEARVTPIRSGGADLGVLVAFRRIDTRKQYEKQLECQNERLEEFAKIVAHDLRNPLNVADGRIELLAERYDSEHVEPIKNALTRMRTIIDETLTLAKQGRYVGETESVPLPELLERSWQTVETPRLTLSVDADAAVLADPKRLRHLFENLFRNTSEHATAGLTGDDGLLRVRVGILRGSDGPTGFFVEDDGSGIPVGERDRIFEPGYTTRDGGTGYGLAITMWIAEAHGWSVTATDGRDGGARFEFTDVDFV